MHERVIVLSLSVSQSVLLSHKSRPREGGGGGARKSGGWALHREA